MQLELCAKNKQQSETSSPNYTSLRLIVAQVFYFKVTSPQQCCQLTFHFS